MYQNNDNNFIYSPNPPEDYRLNDGTRLYICAGNYLPAWNLAWSLFPQIDRTLDKQEPKLDLQLMSSLTSTYFVLPWLIDKSGIEDLQVRERFASTLLQPPTEELVNKMRGIQLSWGLDRAFDLRARLQLDLIPSNVIYVDFRKKSA